jgi:hypothetical protein
MAGNNPDSSIPHHSPILMAIALAFVCLQPSVASAQHPHPAAPITGAGRVAVPRFTPPPVSRGTMVRSRSLGSPVFRVGVHAGLGSRVHFIYVFPRPPLRAAGLFFFGPYLTFNSFWWSPCGPIWNPDTDCNPFSSDRSNSMNYVMRPPEERLVYYYVPAERDLIWLYLKDGSAYAVTDYWFVDGQVQFTAIDERGKKSAEQVIGADELDTQKTIEMNTIRGFRLVMRDEPWEQYLKHHPDQTPPPLAPSPN